MGKSAWGHGPQRGRGGPASWGQENWNPWPQPVGCATGMAPELHRQVSWDSSGGWGASPLRGKGRGGMDVYLAGIPAEWDMDAVMALHRDSGAETWGITALKFLEQKQWNGIKSCIVKYCSKRDAAVAVECIDGYHIPCWDGSSYKPIVARFAERRQDAAAAQKEPRKPGAVTPAAEERRGSWHGEDWNGAGRQSRRRRASAAGSAEEEAEELGALSRHALREVAAHLRDPNSGGRVNIPDWPGRFQPKLGHMREFLEKYPDCFTVVPAKGKRYTVEFAAKKGKQQPAAAAAATEPAAEEPAAEPATTGGKAEPPPAEAPAAVAAAADATEPASEPAEQPTEPAAEPATEQSAEEAEEATTAAAAAAAEPAPAAEQAVPDESKDGGPESS